MTFKKDFEWMFNQQIANLPLTPKYVREEFTKWWERLSKAVGSHKELKVMKVEAWIENHIGLALIERKHPNLKKHLKKEIAKILLED